MIQIEIDNDALRRLLKRLGWSQQKLISKSGLAKETVQKALRGQPLRPDSYAILMDCLNAACAEQQIDAPKSLVAECERQNSYEVWMRFEGELTSQRLVRCIGLIEEVIGQPVRITKVEGGSISVAMRITVDEWGALVSGAAKGAFASLDTVVIRGLNLRARAEFTFGIGPWPEFSDSVLDEEPQSSVETKEDALEDEPLDVSLINWGENPPPSQGE